MNIIKYVKKFGDKTFAEKQFNDIDACILANTSYFNFNIFIDDVDKNTDSNFFFRDFQDKDLKALCRNQTMGINLARLAKQLRVSKRYKDIEVRYVKNVFSPLDDTQFFACTFIVPFVGNYISVRGTDLTVIGWKEDFALAISDVIPSHKLIVKYLEKVAPLLNGPIYLGGHSKGGNLSMYGCINTTKEIQDRLVKVYTFDGPGFAKKIIFEGESYYRIADRLVQVFTVDSYIGAILYTPPTFKIVKSTQIGVFQHDVFSWKISKNGEFELAKRRTKISRVRHRALKKWVQETKVEDKKFLIDAFVLTFGGAANTVLNHFKYFLTNRKYAKAMKVKYTKAQKKILSNCLNSFAKLYLESIIYYKKKAKEARKMLKKH